MSNAISRLRKLAEAATPGPWVEDDGNVFSTPISNADYEARSAARRDSIPQPSRVYDGAVAKCEQTLPNFAADAEFIAAARVAIPLLIDLVEAADRLRRALAVHNLYLSPCFDYDAKRAALDTEMGK